MQIEMSEKEAEVLREALETAVSNLSVQIADTDRQNFRESLKARRDLLRGIAERIPAPTA